MKSHKISGITGEIHEPVKGLSLAEENRQLRNRIAELERLVRRDTLTPLYNRRHFIDVLDRWSWRAHRYGGNFALFFIDVDQLKSVNDEYGHDAGDQLLIAIAKTLQNCVRRSDLAARLGGDEFGLLLENIKPEELEAKAEKIAKAVAKQVVDYNGSILKGSVSVGYTVIQGGASATELLLRADQSMYDVKNGKPRAGAAG
jgi:diguanylate cyclase (GGDEF)-like protein